VSRNPFRKQTCARFSPGTVKDGIRAQNSSLHV
jgi:hypothetical protein